MRPVNLIPPEERRKGTGGRSGPLPYLILGALLAGLAAVVLLVTTTNEIATREGELSTLEHETASFEAVAHTLAPYVSFQAVSQHRAETVTNLANSRFDWPKVMAQLALVLPKDVELTSLSADVRPDVSAGGGESVSLRGGSSGPGLSLAGCASNQEGVANFLSSLKDIDGVTRVGLQSSTGAEAEGEGGGSVSASGSCEGEKTHFQVAVVFDAAPIPASSAGGEEVAVTPEPAPPAEGEETSPSTSTESEGG